MKPETQKDKNAPCSMLHASCSGFTLLETLVAITVLIFAIMGPITLASRSINSAKESKNKIIAFYLAQEGIEYIRKVRDDQSFNYEWMSNRFDLQFCWGTGGCTVNVINNNIANCGVSGCPKIKYDTNDHYNYSTGNETIFTRTIVIDKTISAYESEITSTVSWNTDKSIVLTEHIFDWK